MHGAYPTVEEGKRGANPNIEEKFLAKEPFSCI